MADIADITQDRLEAEEIRHRAAVRVALAAAPAATGRCLNCDASVPHGARWCDTDCREDFERQEDARRRAGRRGG